MSYVSCFSGIGGLEGSEPPLAVCEIDPECHEVLRRKFPSATLHADLMQLEGITCDVIVGGWPCQDLSVAGRQAGLAGSNSQLFYAFVQAAERLQARTIVAENVPNLLSLSGGDVFREVLRQFAERGYPYCAWRTLDAQKFGLPHSRSRVFMIASTDRIACISLFRDIPRRVYEDKTGEAAGFYWTAGTQSICYSNGFVPTIKVGSSLSISSPPAVHYDHLVRPLTPDEILKLQGFDPADFTGIKGSSIYRMAGNAVAVPVGRFVVDGVTESMHEGAFSFHGNSELEFEDKQLAFPSDLLPPKSSETRDLEPASSGSGIASNPHLSRPMTIDPLMTIPKHGFFDGTIRKPRIQRHVAAHSAKNLIDFLDMDSDLRLSARAASGLLRRLAASGLPCPDDLHRDLNAIAAG